MNGITAPLTVDEFPQPEYEIVELPEMAFEGETVSHSYPIEALFNSKNHVHRAQLLRYLETPESLLAPVWGCRTAGQIQMMKWRMRCRWIIPWRIRCTLVTAITSWFRPVVI